MNNNAQSIVIPFLELPLLISIIKNLLLHIRLQVDIIIRTLIQSSFLRTQQTVLLI